MMWDDLILMDQNVMLERIDSSVVLKLEAPSYFSVEGDRTSKIMTGLRRLSSPTTRGSPQTIESPIGVHGWRFDAKIRAECLARTAPQVNISPPRNSPRNSAANSMLNTSLQ
jgi:hypothetical protein